MGGAKRYPSSHSPPRWASLRSTHPASMPSLGHSGASGTRHARAKWRGRLPEPVSQPLGLTASSAFFSSPDIVFSELNYHRTLDAACVNYLIKSPDILRLILRRRCDAPPAP